MPIKISTKLRNAIADQNSIEREAVEDELITRSGGLCWLCDSALNIASDDIEVDHDIPVDSGGTEIIENLHLSHSECNRFKKAYASRDVRNLLRFKKFYNGIVGQVDYTSALPFFKIVPKPSKVEILPSTAKFEFPDGSKHTVPLFSSVHGGEEYKYAFVPVPIEAVYNDDDCQPRLIKLNHAFSIANDIVHNPLHEAPTCRIEDAPGGMSRVLMFDGQHKAIASWLTGQKSVVFKVYTNITRERATTLVNSIQSKIKKLPLTPFELASKLSDEYSDKLSKYEEVVGDENLSEEGFVSWLPAASRATAKKEIEAAVLKEIGDDDSLLFTEVVEMRGRKVAHPWRVTETAFQNKLLKELAYTGPLPAMPFRGTAMQAARLRERQTIIRCLNLIHEKVYAGLDANSAEGERERARRFSYQAALKYVAVLVRKVALNRLVPTSDPLVFIERSPTDIEWAAITTAIERLVSHFVWTAEFESSEQMRAVQDAFSKNQNIEAALKDAGLTPAYCLGIT